MKDTNQETINSYLTFKLGNETFATNVRKVSNILELVKITEVPDSPPYLKGVINLRGSVLPVIDTRIKLDLTPTEFTKNTCILVLNIKDKEENIPVGGLVDAVSEVVQVDDNQISSPPGIGDKYKSDYITNMIKINDNFVMLLDMDKVFGIETETTNE